MSAKSVAANLITGVRILCSIALLFCQPFSPPFIVLYLIAGITDMTDGAMARKTNTTSELGAKLDTAADFVFVAVCLWKLLPDLAVPLWLWIWIVLIVLIKMINMISGYVIQKSFVAIHNPTEEDGAYKQAIGLLYGIAFTIKMSKLGDHRIEGYFDYVVPPLEGFWRQDGVTGIDYAHKEAFHWVSVIRLPDFVTKADFNWAAEEAARKKKTDFSKVEFFTHDEGLCVQCLHIGPFDDEPDTVERMHRYMEEQGYALDISDQRLHHEIYLSDVRKVAPEKLKTVIRHPIRKG